MLIHGTLGGGGGGGVKCVVSMVLTILGHAETNDER